MSQRILTGLKTILDAPQVAAQDGIRGTGLDGRDSHVRLKRGNVRPMQEILKAKENLINASPLLQ
ncbi:MAG TPA: hypothetical protein DD635_07625 [Flavobacteriales bacterium]|nr:hypothetical protein [Flavobacteriales bacterium]